MGGFGAAAAFAAVGYGRASGAYAADLPMKASVCKGAGPIPDFFTTALQVAASGVRF
jgi:hypothetical protein